NYQQAEEIQARARLLGHDLSIPQVVALFELSPDETNYSAGSPQTQWSKRLREELLRTWPTAWVIHEQRRVMALLPCPKNGNTTLETPPNASDEQTILNSLERVQTRLQPRQTRHH